MIVRKLRNDESGKCAKVVAASYTFRYTNEDSDKIFDPDRCFGAFADDGETLMSIAYSVPLKARFCGSYVDCGGFGMAATLPEYRRMGCLRALFGAIFADMLEKGQIFSFLYPFSYSFYRKFGYEQFAVKRVLTFPVSSLPQAPELGRGVLADSEKDLGTINAIYDACTLGLNGAFLRTREMWSKKLSFDVCETPLHTYIWYNSDGVPSSYVTVGLDGGVLSVSDMAYTGPEGLRGAVGFLRSFAGRASQVKFMNVSEDSPLIYVIGEYSGSTGALSSWAMARTVDVGAALSAASYPRQNGGFSIKVRDGFLPLNDAVFDVEYGGGDCTVKKRADGKYDLAVDVTLLTRILMGSDTFTPERLAYCGAEVDSDLSGLLAAFPRRERWLNDSTV